MPSAGAESTYGIMVELNDRTQQGYQQVINNNDQLTRAVEKLTLATEQQAQAQNFSNEIFIGAAEELQRMSGAHGQVAKVVEKSAVAEKDYANLIRITTSALSGKAGIMGKVVSLLGIGGTVGGAFALVLGAIGVASIAAAESLGHYYQRLKQFSELTGIVINDQIVLKTAGENAGRTWDQTQQVITRLAFAIEEAAEGPNAARKAFADLGVTVDGLRPTMDVLTDLQEKIKGIGDEQEKLGALSKIVGRRGAGTFLALLTEDMEKAKSQAKDSGLQLSESQIKIAQTAEQAGNRWRHAWQGMVKDTQTSITPIGIGLQNFFSSVAEGTHKFGEEMRKATDDLKTLGRAGGGGFGGLLGLITPRKPVDVGRSGTEANPFVMPTTRVLGTKGLTPGEQAIRDENRAWQESIDLIRKQTELGVINENQEVNKLVALRQQVTTKERLVQLDAQILALSTRGLYTLPGGVAGPMPEYGPFSPTRMSEYATPMHENTLQGLDDGLTAVDDFLQSLGDFQGVLDASTTATGQLNETTLGYLGTMKLLRVTELELGQMMAHEVMNVAATIGTSAVLLLQGGDKFEEGMRQIVRSITKALGALYASSIGGPLGTLVGGFIEGVGGLFQHGGTLMHGVRGKDTQLGLWGRGETALDTSLTDALRQLVPGLHKLAASGGAGAAPYFAPGAIQITVKELPKGADLDDWTGRELMPSLGRAMRRY